MDNTQHYIEIQLDVFRHPNGSIYRFCGGWVPVEDLESDAESWVVASNSDDGKRSDILVGSGQSRFEYRDVFAACRGNPYDPEHPEYNITDPAGMCFVKSGWYSGDTLTTVSGVLAGVVGIGDGMEDTCAAAAASSDRGKR